MIEPNNPSVVFYITLGDVAVVLSIFVVGWKLLRPVTRLLAILEEYPPHRHVESSILYPKGLKPSREEKSQ